MEQLSGHEAALNYSRFITGGRNENMAIVKKAAQQSGNQGGKVYWNWYGLTERTEWSGIFISWNSAQTGGSIRFDTPQNGADYFKTSGAWQDGGYMNPVAGDIIFFDWYGKNTPLHAGIVAGNDGEYVYTIEGNCGDSCRIMAYKLDEKVIMGYGIGG